MKSSLPKTSYARNASIYKILAHPTRLEILNLLKYREISVEELVKILRLPKANVSQHLALLRHTRVVSVRRNGLRAYYKLVDPRIVEPCKILHELWKSKTWQTP
ncbi:MAG: transcriptional regulator, ArsR family [Parcubacteria group bacterium Gr01-1014_8]|nr:MAG: transcriptional regulator, ArsR family [Parcubacteria group bacterium Gr01-1014_8]